MKFKLTATLSKIGRTLEADRRVIRSLVEDIGLQTDTYVGGLTTQTVYISCDDISRQDAWVRSGELESALETEGFTVHKWVSNQESLPSQEEMDEQDREYIREIDREAERLYDAQNK